MRKLFVGIYSYFEGRKAALIGLLSVVLLALTYFAAQIQFDENLTSFFPKNLDDETEFVMKNIKAMDKIVVALSHKDSTQNNIDALIDVAENYAETLRKRLPENVDVKLYYDNNDIDAVFAEVVEHLPIYLTDSDLARIDTLVSDSAIVAQMATNRQMLLSPVGSGLSHLLPFDPLRISWSVLWQLRSLAGTSTTMVDGYVFDADLRNLLIFIQLPSDFADTGNNTAVVNSVRSEALQVIENQGVDVCIYGAPVVAVSNSQQVKADETIALSIAAALMVGVILLVFPRRRSVFVVLLPVVFGALFALSVIAIIGVKLSLMAVGAGATVLGVALSYSIHMLTHSVHARTIRELIADMAYPMTVGSITTIGAFLGLTFTNSPLLHDLGLFASLTLIGTLLFSLIFLPHFLSADGEQTRTKGMLFFEKIASYDYARHPLIISVLCALTIVCLFFFTSVKFDADMSKLNYEGDAWQRRSKARLESIMQQDGQRATLVVTGRDVNEVAVHARQLTAVVDSLSAEGVESHTSLAPNFLIPTDLQFSRIEAWNAFWSGGKREHVLSKLQAEAKTNGFADGAFSRFQQVISKQYTPINLTVDNLQQSPIASEWISQSGDKLMLYYNLKFSDLARVDNLLDRLDSCPGVVVTDMGYFVTKAAETIVDDFNIILIISSLLVGLALLLSYGRVELFLMTFLPMCIAWVLILGLMALFGVEFNFVNIILSTFIFGVGDDFSIFIMDGLLANYRTRKPILSSHKTAILLSALAIVVGLGVHAFALHPAVRSIGLLSIFGLIAVIFTSYVVQPALFRLFIQRPASRGLPHSLSSIVRTLYYYLAFVVGCVVCNVLIIIVLILPISSLRKRRVIQQIVSGAMRHYCEMIRRLNPIRRIGNIDFSQPRIIIANHQSFFDICLAMTLHPKLILITKTWVNRAPLIGPLVRYSGFYNVDGRSSEMVNDLGQFVREGYSIMIFPEGTRSVDGELGTFYHGAFKLSEQLGLSIAPVLFFGNGRALSKTQPWRIKRSHFFIKCLPLISPSDDHFGTTYRQRTRRIEAYMRQQYDQLRQECDSVHNLYFRHMLHYNYMYKEPLLEWRISLKMKRLHYFEAVDDKVPADAKVLCLNSGYGELPFMLALRSSRRTVVAVEDDDEMRAVAENSLLAKQLSNIHFVKNSDGVADVIVDAATNVVHVNIKVDRHEN